MSRAGAGTTAAVASAFRGSVAAASDASRRSAFSRPVDHAMPPAVGAPGGAANRTEGSPT